jgi:hypothetical protein
MSRHCRNIGRDSLKASSFTGRRGYLRCSGLHAACLIETTYEFGAAGCNYVQLCAGVC